MNYNWNWKIFWEESPDGGGTYLHLLMTGLGWTLATALVAWFFALALGFVMGTLSTVANRRVRALALAYIELFRNVPLLVQMFLWFFVVPELLPAGIGAWVKGYEHSSFATAVASLSFYTSARVSVQIAAGINSLPRGQAMAALAQGMRLWQVYRYILLPQSFRIVLLPLTSEFIGVMKNSAVALTIGLMELTARTRAMTEFSFQTFEAFTAATILYVLINTVVMMVMRVIDKKLAVTARGR
jgi:glutamate/aspartate transport system permease protein